MFGVKKTINNEENIIILLIEDISFMNIELLK